MSLLTKRKTNQVLHFGAVIPMLIILWFSVIQPTIPVILLLISVGIGGLSIALLRPSSIARGQKSKDVPMLAIETMIVWSCFGAFIVGSLVFPALITISLAIFLPLLTGELVLGLATLPFLSSFQEHLREPKTRNTAIRAYCEDLLLTIGIAFTAVWAITNALTSLNIVAASGFTTFMGNMYVHIIVVAILTLAAIPFCMGPPRSKEYDTSANSSEPENSAVPKGISSYAIVCHPCVSWACEKEIEKNDNNNNNNNNNNEMKNNGNFTATV